MGRRTLLLLAALLLAALGTALVWVYVQGADDRARGDNATVNVYITTKPVPLGASVSDLVSQGYVITQTVARRLAVGALTPSSLADLQTYVAVVPIPKDVLLTAGMFSTPDKTPASITFKSGSMALSIALGDPQRVNGFPVQGSYVTIFVTGNGPSSNATTSPKAAVGTGDTSTETTTVIDHPVRVITVGNLPTQPLAKGAAGGTAASTIVTLELTPDEAQKVIQAQASGALYLGLLNSDVKPGPGVGQPSTSAVKPANIFR